MTGTVVVGVVFGLITAMGLRARSRHVEARDAHRRQRLAAIELYTEVRAAIDAADLALRAEDPKWLLSMSESTTLAETWRECAQALTGLDPAVGDLITEAMVDATPRYRLGAGQRPEELRDLLTEKRRLLADAALMLEAVYRGPKPPPPTRHFSDGAAALV